MAFRPQTKDGERLIEVKHWLSPEAFTILIGFSLYLTCGILSSSPSPFVNLPEYDQSGSILSDGVSAAMQVVFLAVLSAISLRSQFARPYMAAVVAAALYAAGILLSYSPEWIGARIDVLLAAGEIFRSAHIVLFVLWARLLCQYPGRLIASIAAGGYCVSYALRATFVNLPTGMAIVAMAILPVLSCLILMIVPLRLRVVAKPYRLGKVVAALPFRQFFGIGVFGLALPLVATTLGTVHLAEDERQMVSLVLAGVSGLLALCLRLVPDSKRDITAYRLTMPIIIAVVLLLYAANTYGIVETAIIEGAWVLYRTMALMAWCALAKRSDLPPTLTLSVSQIVLAVCLALADPIGMLTASMGVPSIAVVGVSIIATVLASTFLLHENDYRDFAFPVEPSLDKDGDAFDQHAEAFGLSQQELHVCELVLSGRSSEEICEELFIARNTLKVHLRNIYGKAGVHSRKELVDLFRAK